MTDDEVRALERAFKESGAVEDEARWLGARVRAGVMSSGQLEVLACVGNAGAAHALGKPPKPAAPEKRKGWLRLGGLFGGSQSEPPTDARDELMEWLAGICGVGPVPGLRAAVAVARALITESLGEGVDLLRSVRLVEEWLLDPTRPRADATGEALAASSIAYYDGHDPFLPAFEIGDPRAETVRPLVQGFARELYRRKSIAYVHATREELVEADRRGATACRAPVARELSAWALGHDPVRARREAFPPIPGALRTPSPTPAQAEALELLDRVRAGDLDHDRLRLAAFLNDRAATAAVGDEVTSYGECDLDHEGVFYEQFQPWQPQWLAQLAVCCSRIALELWKAHGVEGPSLEPAFQALVAWADSQTAEDEQAFETEASELEAQLEGLPELAAAAAQVLCTVAADIDGMRQRPPHVEFVEAFDSIQWTAEDAGVTPPTGDDWWRFLHDRSRDALVSWLLGRP